MARPSYDPESLLVGVFGRPHGLAGEVTLRSYNSGGADLTRVPVLILDRESGREQHVVRRIRRGGSGWLVQLQGIESRDAAAALTHALVRVPKASLPPLAPGEFFVEDLLGCQVTIERGDVLGVVDGVFWNGAQDVMSVVGPGEPGAQREHLIPLVPTFVRSVDAPGRRVVVAWDDQPTDDDASDAAVSDE